MWDVMNASIIMHNIIIDSGCVLLHYLMISRMRCRVLLPRLIIRCGRDYQFLSMQVETRDKEIHNQLQNDLVEHL